MLLRLLVCTVLVAFLRSQTAYASDPDFSGSNGDGREICYWNMEYDTLMRMGRDVSQLLPL